jgi:nanoRNase/pAp phosphatase (c-di-AMP/oligoRNAs hydrolase)
LLDFKLDYKDLRKKLKGRVIILCHHNADPDSLCSAYAVKELVAKLDSSSTGDIFAPGGFSSITKKIIEKLNIEVINEPNIKEYQALVIVDTATLEQLDGWRDIVSTVKIPKVIMDHHSAHSDTISLASINIVNEEATSTCEIVYKLYEKFGFEPSETVAKALLLGIAYDSKHFSIGTAESYQTISDLLKIGGPVHDITNILSVKKDRSEKIARLKGGKRVQLYFRGEWILATSSLDSFHASVARGLIGLGADVAVVAGNDNKKLRTSLRSTNDFAHRTSIHLGHNIAKRLGEEFKGSGSGHPTAAGINGEGDSETLLKRSIELITQKLVLT